jgi:hypothetical protein
MDWDFVSQVEGFVDLGKAHGERDERRELDAASQCVVKTRLAASLR